MFIIGTAAPSTLRFNNTKSPHRDPLLYPFLTVMARTAADKAEKPRIPEIN
jgi:hypothetical protein